ncbi:FAD/NAD(P)-binding domain-containing protein [Stipitochalara longipes BDJ]|nr:FAD/NAD(P)-binding domain-containing protein [Stipitochalara longipes BDJ]
MSPNNLRIAILGAGPAGLTLASLLTHASVPYTLYDLRAPPTATSATSPLVPSGSLDLHADSGLLALSSCGLADKFKALEREGSEECILTNKNGDVKWRDDGMGGQRPEIARNDLTALLQSSIPASQIKWNHKLLSVSRVPAATSGRFKLSFSTGEGEEKEEVTDIVIGADGAWSKTRLLVTNEKPHFSSVSCITLTIPQISRYPDLAAIIGQGSFYASGEKKAVIAQRGSLGSARIYAMLSSSSESYLEISGLEEAAKEPEEIKKMLLSSEGLFASWGQGIKDLLATGCDAGTEFEITAKPLYMLPVGFRWDHVDGVTVIGDAAHLMTPFAGEGVNCGMLDALELSRGLVDGLSKGVDAVDMNLRTFEQNMWQRMTGAAQETLDNLEVIFAEDAPDGFVKVMESHGPPPEEP